MKYREPSEYILNINLEKVKIFNLTKKKGGILPAIITIDGFLNQDLNETKDWKRALLLKYPNNAWYHLHWQSENTRTLLVNSLTSIFYSLTSIYSIINILDVPVSVGKTWRTALNSSKQTGEILANILVNSEVNEFILIGHSLGSSVIFHCLDKLSEQKVKIIYEVHLVGGAVSNDKKSWSRAERAIGNRIFNYYSKKDRVLQSLYKLGTFDLRPIGRTTIDTEKSANIDVTKFVDGHMTFKENFSKYIK